MDKKFRNGAVLTVLAALVAGCNSGPAKPAGKTTERLAPLQTAALPRCGQYLGATRQQILDMCDFFPHYGPDRDQIAIGLSGRVRYFDSAAEAKRDKELMTAPVWWVNFYKSPDGGWYHYDELRFGADNRVEDNQCGELTGNP